MYFWSWDSCWMLQVVFGPKLWKLKSVVCFLFLFHMALGILCWGLWCCHLNSQTGNLLVPGACVSFTPLLHPHGKLCHCMYSTSQETVPGQVHAQESRACILTSQMPLAPKRCVSVYWDWTEEGSASLRTWSLVHPFLLLFFVMVKNWPFVSDFYLLGSNAGLQSTFFFLL